jgi:hypothetical protein
MKGTLIAVCAAALIAGCAVVEQFTQSEKASQFPAYDQGWRDGCATGLYVRAFRFTGGPLATDRYALDTERFSANKDYAVGWGDGVQSCDTGRPEGRRLRKKPPARPQ